MASSTESPSSPRSRSSRALAGSLAALASLLLAPAAAADDVLQVTLAAPPRGDYGAPVELRGSVSPAIPGARVTIYRGETYVATVIAASDGAWSARIRLGSPGPYEARLGELRSAAATIAVRPRLTLALARTAALGSRLVLEARLEPAAAGTLSARAVSGSRALAEGAGKASLRLAIPTRRSGEVEAVVDSAPEPGWEPVTARATSSVVVSNLALGARGDSVRSLERLLAERRYLLRGIDDRFEEDTRDAVLAFQKLHGLPRTGIASAALWRSLATAAAPKPRYGGADHIEVDKARQVLVTVEGGEVTRIVHVSTGLTGNTPVGAWRVYRKVPGWSWVLWYPMFFKGGFAIHGYPSVPAYPASHGCVRVPMWAASKLYSSFGLGTAIYVHL